MKKISKQQQLILRDMAIASQYHALPTNTRVQIKMPSAVVETLDALFPNIDRSQVLTQLALEAITRQLRFTDNPELSALAETEQTVLDQAWSYLEKREKHV